MKDIIGSGALATAFQVQMIDPRTVRKAQLTVVELCNYGEGDISKQELSELLDMITPTDAYTADLDTYLQAKSPPQPHRRTSK